MFYKVVVSHGDEEPITTSKEIYDAAHNLFIAECGNAARVVATKPGCPVVIELFNPCGTLDKSITITSIKKNKPSKQLDIFNP